MPSEPSFTSSAATAADDSLERSSAVFPRPRPRPSNPIFVASAAAATFLSFFLSVPLTVTVTAYTPSHPIPSIALPPSFPAQAPTQVSLSSSTVSSSIQPALATFVQPVCSQCRASHQPIRARRASTHHTSQADAGGWPRVRQAEALRRRHVRPGSLPHTATARPRVRVSEPPPFVNCITYIISYFLILQIAYYFKSFLNST